MAPSAPKSGVAVGLNKGHVVSTRELAQKPSYRKGHQSKRTKFVRDLVREVVGFAPYERRLMELIRVSKDKRARRLAKKKLGDFGRGKKKVDELTTIIQESRRAH
ncbi:60S ribosomal protein L36 [Cladochytrium replicatum]|nr:60S ribosomal protein L36 [Cladochytrium replicatum]